jgi:hypothetical protein
LELGPPVTAPGSDISTITISGSAIRVHRAAPHPRAASARTVLGTLADTTVADDVVVNGTLSGEVRVEPGAFLQLNGTLDGQLTVAEGGEVRVHGSVQGVVRNRGRVEVLGEVGGSLLDEPPGESVVHPGEPLED